MRWRGGEPDLRIKRRSVQVWIDRESKGAVSRRAGKVRGRCHLFTHEGLARLPPLCLIPRHLLVHLPGQLETLPERPSLLRPIVDQDRGRTARRGTTAERVAARAACAEEREGRGRLVG